VSERPTPQQIAREWWALADEQTEGTNTEALYRSYGDETAKLERQLAEAQERIGEREEDIVLRWLQAEEPRIVHAEDRDYWKQRADEALAARDRAVERIEKLRRERNRAHHHLAAFLAPIERLVVALGPTALSHAVEPLREPLERARRAVDRRILDDARAALAPEKEQGR
jgi:hypothetical protein